MLVLCYTAFMSKIIGTVCFIISKNKVLLAEIEYPDGRRLWNGIGGVVDEGEAPAQAVLREISEETKLAVNKEDVVEAAVVQIGDLELHVFTATNWEGELITIDPTLKQLKWFDVDSVPYAHMHKGNDTWLPGVLAAALH